MEAVDVDAGEYSALFTLDGRIVTATTEAEQVVLTVDEQRDEAGLRQRLLDARPRVGLTSPPDDLVAIAGVGARWPKRPRWLARWLHGEGPHAV
jgi:hypothetical protein